MAVPGTAIWRGLACGVAFCALSAALALAQTVTIRTSSQPLSEALKQIARQSGVNILFIPQDVSGMEAKPLQGDMTAEQAVQSLLAGSDLEAAPDGNGGIVIRKKSTQKESRATPVEEVVVTGVRGVPRTVISSPTPIDVIGATELDRGGRAGAFQALETLVPSFNLPARAGGGISTVIATGGLRGLNPDEALILVNGKRRHKTSLINSVSSLYNGSVPADLDLIPISGINRIEVLRDGAAAQYGSDAIAGVINILLKETEGGSVSASYGRNFDRNDGALTQVNGDYGFNLDNRGFLDLFVGYKNQELSNRAVPVAPNIQIYPKLANGRPDPRELTVNRLVTQNYGVLPQDDINLGYNGHYDLGGIQFYSFGTYSHRNTDLPFTFRAPNNVNTLPQLYPEGFRPLLKIDEDDFEFAFGGRGEYLGWSWDLSSTFGQNHANETATQTLNASLGPTSPTSFYVGQLTSSEWVNSLDVTKGFKVHDGDLQVSFGAQHRRETYDVGAGDPASFAAGTYVIPAGQPFAGQRPATGAQATPGITPADASNSSRNNLAAYVELGYTPIQSLFLGAAGRFEHYDDASGDSLVGKGDVRYAITDWLAVRGAVSNGFRAPALAQEHWSASASQFQLVNGQLQLLQIKTLPVNSPSAIALGAKPLQPEKSQNFSGGLTLDPDPRLAVTVDAYQINVDGRIALTGTLTGAAISNILVAQGLPGNLSAQYYTNAINTSTKGMDFVSTWRQDLDAFGVLKLNLGYNNNRTKITHIIPNPPQLNALGANFVLFDRLSQGYLTTAFPKDKISLGANWSWNDFNLLIRETRYGEYTVIQDVPSQDRNFNARWIADIEVSYRFFNRVTWAVGANNLFNVYPQANGIFNTTTGSGQYPGTSPFGFTGGSYYTRVTVEF